MPEPNQAYPLTSIQEQQRRRGMLSQEHMSPLTRYVEAIRSEEYGRNIADFDPCDGGINAKALFLFESPGSKTLETGFISPDNPDPTAKNMSEFLRLSNISRADIIAWNVVPWHLSDGKNNRAIEERDLARALPYLKDLFPLLRQLKVVVLVGLKAQSAFKNVRELTSLPIIKMNMPSLRVFNSWPEKRAETLTKFSEIARYIQR